MNSPEAVTVRVLSRRQLKVPESYSTIQTAIDAAVNDDQIVVSEGTYNENINFGGKDITLKSTDPYNWLVVENTIIQGTGSGCVVTFAGSETSNCILSGFTITGGKGLQYGGAIRCVDSSPVIRNCVVRYNSAGKAALPVGFTGYGGGIYFGNSFGIL